MSRATRYRTSRWRIRPAVMTFGAILWAFLWASVSPIILISGALLGYAMGVIFPLPPMHWKGRLHPKAFAWLIVKLMWDLIISSFRLVAMVFQRKVDLHPGMIRVDLLADDDLYQVGVASLVSLVPGTVVVEVVRHPRRLYLHCVGLPDEDPEDFIQQMTTDVEHRLLQAFGSDEEQQAFEEKRTTPSVVPPTDWAAEEADAEEDN